MGFSRSVITALLTAGAAATVLAVPIHPGPTGSAVANAQNSTALVNNTVDAVPANTDDSALPVLPLRTPITAREEHSVLVARNSSSEGSGNPLSYTTSDDSNEPGPSVNPSKARKQKQRQNMQPLLRIDTDVEPGPVPYKPQSLDSAHPHSLGSTPQSTDSSRSRSASLASSHRMTYSDRHDPVLDDERPETSPSSSRNSVSSSSNDFSSSRNSLSVGDHDTGFSRSRSNSGANSGANSENDNASIPTGPAGPNAPPGHQLKRTGTVTMANLNLNEYSSSSEESGPMSGSMVFNPPSHEHHPEH